MGPQFIIFFGQLLHFSFSDKAFYNFIYLLFLAVLGLRGRGSCSLWSLGAEHGLRALGLQQVQFPGSAAQKLWLTGLVAVWGPPGP